MYNYILFGKPGYIYDSELYIITYFTAINIWTLVPPHLHLILNLDIFKVWRAVTVDSLNEAVKTPDHPIFFVQSSHVYQFIDHIWRANFLEGGLFIIKITSFPTNWMYSWKNECFWLYAPKRKKVLPSNRINGLIKLRS